MACLNRAAPDLYAEASKLFKQHQDGRTDVTAAEQLFADVLPPPTSPSPALPQDPAVTLEYAPHSGQPAQDEEEPGEDAAPESEPAGDVDTSSAMRSSMT